MREYSPDNETMEPLKKRKISELQETAAVAIVMAMNKPRLKCKECSQTYATKATLRKHMQTVHGVGRKRYFCTICLKEFKDNNVLRKHRLYVHDEVSKWHDCKNCDKRFKTGSDLRRHEFAAHGIGGTFHKCHLCPKLCKQSAHLKQHLANVHGIGTQWYHCPACPKKMKHRGNMLRHIQRVHKYNNVDSLLLSLSAHPHARVNVPAIPAPRQARCVKVPTSLLEKENKEKTHPLCTLADADVFTAEGIQILATESPILAPTACVCDRCDQPFRTQAELDQHLLRVHHTREVFEA